MVEIMRDDTIHAMHAEPSRVASLSETLDLIDKLRSHCFAWIKARGPIC
ncbi:hypothetical protein NU688_32935 [Variovorax sp. ZS18.2.2]|nr:hypothetical protein [Variovorax sp. ZS18.2.2]MCR6481003.1 hypothetical protein [Variovorax sp. ZS18.2.2]